MSLAKLAKIETGRATPRTIDVARILAALSTDPDHEAAAAERPGQEAPTG